MKVTFHQKSSLIHTFIVYDTLCVCKGMEEWCVWDIVVYAEHPPSITLFSTLSFNPPLLKLVCWPTRPTMEQRDTACWRVFDKFLVAVQHYSLILKAVNRKDGGEVTWMNAKWTGNIAPYRTLHMSAESINVTCDEGKLEILQSPIWIGFIILWICISENS